MALTITEALAEIKTIGKRIDSKKTFIQSYLARQEGIKDPLEKDGGSFESIKRERHAINDLETRIVALRRGIQRANEVTTVTLEGMAMPIADWLVWRRDVMPGRKSFLNDLRNRLNGVREAAKRQGAIAGAPGTAMQPADVVINVDEATLAKEIEQMVNIEGQLDGQLSLKNATIGIVEE